MELTNHIIHNPDGCSTLSYFVAFTLTCHCLHFLVSIITFPLVPLFSPSPPSLHCEEKRDEERWECCDASFNVIVIIQVSAEGDAEPEQVSVVQGIPVKTSENAPDVAEARIDLGEEYEDQGSEAGVTAKVRNKP